MQILANACYPRNQWRLTRIGYLHYESTPPGPRFSGLVAKDYIKIKQNVMNIKAGGFTVLHEGEKLAPAVCAPEILLSFAV